MNSLHALLEPLLEIHRALRSGIMRACEEQEMTALAAASDDMQGDTLFAIDKIGEAILVPALLPLADQVGGLVLIAEGIAGGKLVLPHGTPDSQCPYRVIIDPIDGTRGLMYQKRSAWILTGVAPNRGSETCLSDIEMSVQTEIPLLKQHLCDELWAIRGQGAHARRLNRLTQELTNVSLRPSQSPTLAHGFATISRFFPGARDELAAIDDQLMFELMGHAPLGKALCFEDQYLSTGGQLYELMVGHDRFVADLRPMLTSLIQARGFPLGLCCHPYDFCTALIAEEAGVVLCHPAGGRVESRLDTEQNLAWAGYANQALADTVQPVLHSILTKHGLLSS